jgi:thymidylate synthase
MNSVDKQYKQLLQYIIENGNKKSDRTGTGTISVFDYTIRFNMKEGFPLLTSKKMYTKGVIHELIWFLRGDTNIKYLVDNDCHIWDGDCYKHFYKEASNIKIAYEEGDLIGSQPDINNMFSNADELVILTKEEFINRIKTNNKFAKKWSELGPIYGKQWRNFGGTKRSTKINKKAKPIEWTNVDGVDQIKELIEELRINPDSRRLMVNAWNVSDLHKMTLPPCHYGFQCYTKEMEIEERIQEWCESINVNISYGEDMTNETLDKIGFPKRKLSLKWTQRSVDTFLGLPFNIASYGLLLHLLAKEVNMIPDDLIFSGGDVHLYSNHIEQAKEMLARKEYKLPKLVLNNTSIYDLKYEDIKIENYQSDSVLKADLSN